MTRSVESIASMPLTVSRSQKLAWSAVPYLLAAMMLVLGFSSLDRYNVTWDAALGDLFFGERYLSFFSSFDDRYLDFRSNPYPPDHRPDLSSSPFRGRPWEHYPVASTLATATSRLFSALGGFLDPFDGFHAFNLILGAIFLIVLFRFCEEWFGKQVALCAVTLLFLLPRVVADLMSNIKDFPEMVFFSLSILFVFRGIERANGIILGAGSLFLALALGTKANALFVPVIVVLFLVLRRIPETWTGRKANFGVALALWLGGAGLLFVASWPYLWADPIGRLSGNIQYIVFRKLATDATHAADPFRMIVYTAPVAFLIAVIAGIPALVSRLRQRDPPAMLVASWAGVVLGRVVAPGSINFDGVRHFLELFPPLAIIAGLGITSVASAMARRLPFARGAFWIVFLIVTLPCGISLWRVHPFETAYWNFLTGGLSGAVARETPQAGDYWAASYRLGLDWLNTHAEPNSALVVPVAEHTVRLVAPYRLRRDIELVHVSSPRRPALQPGALARVRETAQRKPLYVMFVLRKDWANELMIDSMRRLRPQAVWEVDGVPVLLVFRYTEGPGGVNVGTR